MLRIWLDWAFIGRLGTSSFRDVHLSMATGAQCDQVLFGVVARLAAKLFVMDFQVRHPPAGLTPPAIAAQDLLPEALIGRSIQPQA
jgi:hypothetical protein